MLLQAVIAMAASTTSKNYIRLFESWKETYGKSYASTAVEAMALRAFISNEDTISSHNAQNLSYSLGHNEYSDLSADEFFASRLGFNASVKVPGTPHTAMVEESLPHSVDWVAKGGVSPV